MLRTLLTALLLGGLRRQHPELFDGRLALEAIEAALREQSE